MNRTRKKLSNNKTASKKNKIVRFKSKKIPVLEIDIYKNFLKKENTHSNNICKNCKSSF